METSRIFETATGVTIDARHFDHLIHAAVLAQRRIDLGIYLTRGGVEKAYSKFDIQRNVAERDAYVHALQLAQWGGYGASADDIVGALRKLDGADWLVGR